MRTQFDDDINELLMNIGISPKLIGYTYIIEAVKIACEDPSYLSLITKKLYLEIAAEFDTCPANVERNIRNAIEISCTKGNISYINKLFRYIDGEKGKPSNSQFIATLVGYMWTKSRVA